MVRKKLQDLTIKDDFMFAAVMMTNNNCKRLLELIFQREINEVIIEKEKNIVDNPTYRGVRLDIYFKDKNNTRYNIEMQALSVPAIEKRSRFYHAHIAMDLLRTGEDYELMPDTYVIFICDFDPFGYGRYIYSFENVCLEDGELKLKDGSHTVFLSTTGTIAEGVKPELIKFLRFVKADIGESNNDYGDEYVSRLQETIRQIKSSREMENNYMKLEFVLREERRSAEARGEAKTLVSSIIRVLNSKGEVSESLASRINSETDNAVLNKWFDIAIKSDDPEIFEKTIS